MTKADKPKRIYAFIDAQNVQQTTKSQGWRYDLFKFRQYLHDKHKVTRAIMFIGKVSGMKTLYHLMERAGFEIEFKETIKQNGVLKGNVDVNLTLYAARYIDDYDHAILVSADGDFYPLVAYWRETNKKIHVLSPATVALTSRLLTKYAGHNISYMPNIRRKIER